MTRKRSIAHGMMVLCAVMFISACEIQPARNGQTIVKVNDKEITIHQVNEELSSINGVPAGEESMHALRKKVIDGLIDRQLIVSEAVRLKMDRDPSVMLAIERAKAQILAKAFMQARVTMMDKPSRQDMEAYLNQHPELFSKRKVYDVTELQIKPQEPVAELQSELEKADQLDELVAWLDKNKIQFEKRSSQRTSADLPRDLLDKALKDDGNKLFFTRTPELYSVISIRYVKDSPVTENEALVQIERFLQNQQIQEKIKAELAHLRTSAKLEYVNKAYFSEDPENEKNVTKLVSHDKASAEKDDHIQKGAAGLR